MEIVDAQIHAKQRGLEQSIAIMDALGVSAAVLDDWPPVRQSYGIEEFRARNALPWPAFATADHIRDLPPTMISVNECDPLRDEGIQFYRLLMQNGVKARCRQVMGTIHGAEIFPICCPDISRDTAADIAGFCKRG